MVDLGFFDEDEHVELLEGMLVKTSPHGGPHASVLAWLNAKLTRSLPEEYLVRPQLPFAASDWSEPEPDLAVVKTDWTTLDHPSEVLLLIEVAASSVRIDRTVKLAVYAKARVPEYWIVDVETMTVEVYTEPSGKLFKMEQVLRDGDTLRPTKLPGIAIPVADLPR